MAIWPPSVRKIPGVWKSSLLFGPHIECSGPSFLPERGHFPVMSPIESICLSGASNGAPLTDSTPTPVGPCSCCSLLGTWPKGSPRANFEAPSGCRPPERPARQLRPLLLPRRRRSRCRLGSMRPGSPLCSRGPRGQSLSLPADVVGTRSGHSLGDSVGSHSDSCNLALAPC